MNRVTNKKFPHLGGNIDGGDKRTWYPELWAYLIGRLKIKSMMDVGCGQGHAVEYFKNHGIDAFGIDGLEDNIRKLEQKGLRGNTVDLTKTAYFKLVDLIWCCEVVEHIDEKYLDNLLTTLSSGKYIVMTHAVKGQGGFHHVNCQDWTYWKEKIEGKGYELLVKDSKYSRNFAHNYYKRTGLIFKKK